MNTDELVAAALRLSHRERASLARRLLCSLDGEKDTPDLDELWLEESERRLDQVLSGQVLPIPAEDAVRRVRQSLA